MVVGLETVCFLLLKRNVWRTLCALKQIVGSSKRGYPSETRHGFKSSPGAASVPQNRSLETAKAESRMRPRMASRALLLQPLRLETDRWEHQKQGPEWDPAWLQELPCCSLCAPKQMVGNNKGRVPNETPHGFKSFPVAASAPRNRSLETTKGEARWSF